MIPRAFGTVFSVCGAVLVTAGAALAQDWPHWRGPTYEGAAQAKGLPTDFDKDKHVRWAADLPGAGASTPIVVGDKIFLSSVDEARERLVALCLSRSTGEVLWQKDAGSGYQPGGRGSRVSGGRRSTYSSPSPTTDGERVVFFFGNGDLVAYDLQGEELWRRNIQKDYGDFAFLWTFSASPTIWEGKVFLPVLQRDVTISRRRGGSRGGRGRGRGGPQGGRNRGDQRGGGQERQEPEPPVDPIPSFVLGLDPTTGETLFKQERSSPAVQESREAYTTMIPYVGAGGRKEMLLVGGDVVTGHDPETGAELWRWGTWNEGHRQRSWRLVPTVVAADGVAILCAPKRAPVYAIRLGGEGELDEGALVWQSEGRPNPVSSDVPTPAFYGGYLYVLSDVRSALSKVDAKNGEVLWTTDMPGDALWRASPTAADGKIWCMNHDGEVVVVDAGDGEIVHRVLMGEEDDDQTRSSVVVAHDSLFIRTNAKLYCVGK